MKADPPRNNDVPGNGAATAGFGLLHADDSLLVLDKPAGLLAVPGRGEDKQDCLSARVQAAWPDALVVHRLDQATSGLMLMARGADMQRALSQAFENREVHKRYVAVVEGCLPSPVVVGGDGDGDGDGDADGDGDRDGDGEAGVGAGATTGCSSAATCTAEGTV